MPDKGQTARDEAFRAQGNIAVDVVGASLEGRTKEQELQRINQDIAVREAQVAAQKQYYAEQQAKDPAQYKFYKAGLEDATKSDRLVLQGLYQRKQLVEQDLLTEERAAQIREGGRKFANEPRTGGMGYSDPGKAIGYDAATGTVRIGAGDLRGTVISTSKTEDVARKRAAGYTESATVDDRVSDLFKPVEGGIYGAETPKAKPTPSTIAEISGVRPQRERKKALQNQPGKLFGSPDFISRGEESQRIAETFGRTERPKAQTGIKEKLFMSPSFVTKEKQGEIDEARKNDVFRASALDRFAPSVKGKIKTSGKTKALQVSLYESAVPKPKELTQSQFEKLSIPDQQAYINEINAYNRYQTQKAASALQAEKTKGFSLVRITSGGRTYDTSIDAALQLIRSGSFTGSLVVSPKDKLILEAKQGQIRYQQDLKTLINEAQSAGITQVTITANGITKSVPIGQARKELIKAQRTDPNAAIRPTFQVNLAESLSLSDKPMGLVRIEQSETGQITQTVGPQQITPRPFEINRFAPLSVSGLDVTGIYGKDQGLVTVSPAPQPKPSATSPVSEYLSDLTRGFEGSATRAKGNFLAEGIVELGREGFGIFTGGVNIVTSLAGRPELQAAVPETLTGIGTTQLFSAGERYYEISPIPKLLPSGSIKVETPKPINQTKALEQAGEGATKDLEGILTQGQQYVQQYGYGTLPGALLAAVLPGGGKLQPFRYGKLPIIVEGQTVRAASAVGLGYGKWSVVIIGKYGPAGEGKFFLGRPDPSKYGLRGVQGAAGSSFNVYQVANIPAFERARLFEPAVKYAERERITPAGGLELIKAKEKALGITQSAPFEYIKTVPPDLLEKTLNPNIRTGPTLGALGTLEKKKIVDTAKGSIGLLFGKDSLYRRIGDIDFEASLKKVEVGIDYVLARSSKIAREGFTLGRKGSNIEIGEADLTKPIYNITLKKGQVIHGTNLPNAKNIMTEGFEPSKRPYGEPAAFATPTPNIAERFSTKAVRQQGGKPSAVLLELEESNTLTYRKIPKAERKTILNIARSRSKESIKLFKKGKTERPKEFWETYQEELIGYAKKKGYGVVTKPYKTTNPLTENYEAIIFERGVTKPLDILKPSRYGIKEGTGQKLINFVTEREELKAPEGITPGKVFGKKYPKDIQKVTVPKEKDKFQFRGQKGEAFAAAESTSNIISKESFEGVMNISPETQKAIMGDFQFVFGAKPQRYAKDIMKEMMGYRQTARVLFKAGRKEEALEIGKAMKSGFSYYKGIDWVKEFREFKPTAELQAPPKDIPSASARLGKALGARTPVYAKPTLIPRDTDNEPIQRPDYIPIFDELVMRAARIGKGDYPVSADIKIARSKFVGGAPAYVSNIRPGKIFLTDTAQYAPEQIASILSHETLHGVLDKMIMPKASSGVDIFEYGELAPKTIEKLAPSLKPEFYKRESNVLEIIFPPEAIVSQKTSGFIPKENLERERSPLPTSISSKQSLRSAQVSARSASSRTSALSGRSPLLSARASARSAKSALEPSARPSSALSGNPSPRSAFSKSALSRSAKSPLSPSGRSPISPKSTSPLLSSPLSRSSISPSPLSPRSISPRSVSVSPLSMITPKPLSVRKLPIFDFQGRTKKEKRREKEEKERADFLGNALVSQITGLTKRGDITYGLSRTEKEARKDFAFSAKGRKSFVNARSFSLISKKQKPLIPESRGKFGRGII